MIDHDAYKYGACSITGDECFNIDCQDCGVAKDHNTDWKKEEAKAEFERYTKFKRKSKIVDTEVMVDVYNVIAKTDMETLKHLQETTEFFKKTLIAYHPDNLKQYAEHLRKLRKYNNLGIPDLIWGAKNYPAAFLFRDVIYLIAPRIENEI